MTETARSALHRGAAVLQNAGVDGGGRDASILLGHILGIDAVQLGQMLDLPLKDDAVRGYDQAISARAQFKPVSHITGKRAFWNHDFLVTADVLDPRPDTESLVALALEHPFERLLDLGTGSGVIALSLLAAQPGAVGVATDISAAALDIAGRNAARMGLSGQVEFIRSDWFEAVTERFDLVVCNPPYISASEMVDLSPDVVNWEPHHALTPGGDGLACYRIIAAKLADYLTPQGRAIFEIGHLQAFDVSEIFTKAGFDNVNITKDLSGHDRVVAINT